MGERLQRASDPSGKKSPTYPCLHQESSYQSCQHQQSCPLEISCPPLPSFSMKDKGLWLRNQGDRKSTVGMICASSNHIGSITSGLNKMAMEQYQRYLECSAPFQRLLRPEPQPACPAMWKGKCQSYSWMPDPNLPGPADPFGQPIWEQDGWHRAAVAECADAF